MDFLRTTAGASQCIARSRSPDVAQSVGGGRIKQDALRWSRRMRNTAPDGDTQPSRGHRVGTHFVATSVVSIPAGRVAVESRTALQTGQMDAGQARPFQWPDQCRGVRLADLHAPRPRYPGVGYEPDRRHPNPG